MNITDEADFAVPIFRIPLTVPMYDAIVEYFFPDNNSMEFLFEMIPNGLPLETEMSQHLESILGGEIV